MNHVREGPNPLDERVPDGPIELTIAIPHYNQRRYLELNLDRIFDQTHRSFEILVSDDGSSDDSNAVIPRILRESGRPFAYYAQSSNLGYDGNVRFCLRAARGRHALLLGNDDALASSNTVSELIEVLEALGPQVAFTNFALWEAPTRVTRRAVRTGVLGRGPEAAVRHFRTLSFVSGLVFDTAAATAHETERWDGSIYYQMYLGARIVAAGGTLASLDVCAVHKDIRIEGRTVPTHATRLANASFSLSPRHTGLDSVIRVTSDAILPYVDEKRRSSHLRRICLQIFGLTYPYWLIEYRDKGNWSSAAGVARGLWPRPILSDYTISFWDRGVVWFVYLVATFFGLLVPRFLSGRLLPRAARFVRSFLSRGR